MNYNQLNKTYVRLLADAENATSRKEAIYFIRQADKVRLQMCRTEVDYPLIYSQ